MRILVWHGWLLEGTGSNVYAAKTAEVWRRQGHEVVMVCQQGHPERLGFIDAWRIADAGGVGDPTETGAEPAAGSVVLIRPDIGSLLPVFVYDRYEGFDVKRFVDLDEAELRTYLDRSVAALSAAAGWAAPEATVAGHLVPGGVVARRAVGDRAYAVKVHGSDLEYAVRLQERYAELAREGVAGARSVVGASRDVLARTVGVAPAAQGRTRVIPPGVDVDRWRPRDRTEALQDAAARLAAEGSATGGRTDALDGRARDALAARDAAALDALAREYDQGSPDPAAPDRLRELAAVEGPVVGYLGKLIPEKGVERLLEAAALVGSVRTVIVGFGLHREWLTALVAALDSADTDAYAWLRERSRLRLELSDDEVRAARGLAGRVAFTGRLDHRYAPEVVAATDVLVVPSTLEEAFGMVAAEGAAAGAVPLVARHSSLAEVAEALEGASGRPGLLSFEPGRGATRRIAESLERVLGLSDEERSHLRRSVRDHVAGEWTWERTAERLLEAAAA